METRREGGGGEKKGTRNGKWNEAKRQHSIIMQLATVLPDIRVCSAVQCV